MIEARKTLVFLVDDDAFYLKALEIDFKQNEAYEVKTFSSGELCLLALDQNPDIIILDYQLDSIEEGAIDGIQTLDKIKEFNAQIPVIIVSAQDKIAVAVDCMKHQALDYFVKSETAYIRLDKAIQDMLKRNKMQQTLNWYMNKS